MLTEAENELLTRVGPATAGGALLRRYWHPVAKAEEADAGGAPRHVRLLAQDFVLFRAAGGRLGLVDYGCPHRRAPLVLARNEECGLRCLYHGWKIGFDGAVVETPSEPAPHQDLAAKIRTRSYHTREVAGLIWTFIGEGEPPAFPAFPFTSEPVDHLDIIQVRGRCNWVQLLEGQVDPSHVSYLHASSVHKPGAGAATTPVQAAAMARGDRAPRLDVENTPWGFRVAGTRSMPDGRWYTRVTEFVMPYWQCIPPTAAPGTPEYEDAPRLTVCEVPVDDTTTLAWHIWQYPRPVLRGPSDTIWQQWSKAVERLAEIPLWGQDREKMKLGHSTGLENLLAEDMAVAELMGPIVDRSDENLGSSDAGVTRFRRRYLDAVRRNGRGEPPPAASSDVPFPALRGLGLYHPVGVDWRDAARDADSSPAGTLPS